MLKIIDSIQGAGTYESQHGTLYSFEYVFEDDSTIKANHKTLTSPFKSGDEVEVIVKGSRDNFSWGQVKKPESANFNSSNNTTGKDETVKRIESSWAINTAVLALGNLSGDKDAYLNRVDVMAKKLLKLRDKLVKMPYSESEDLSSSKWTKEDMLNAEAEKENNLPVEEVAQEDLPF
jgi:hypothetical protein